VSRRRPASPRAPAGRIQRWGPYDIPGIGVRGVRVYVPRGRAERSVVMLFDGQNVFGDQGSFAGGWHAQHAAERVVTKRRAAPIVVGVDHGHEERLRELVPFRRGSARQGLDALVAFLADRLAPEVSRRCGVPLDARRWIIGGSSLGGLAALYAHLTVPELFGGALCMSPSFWIVERRIYDWVATRSLPRTSRIYLDCGVREGRGRTLPRVRAMAAVLRRRGYDPTRLRLRADARGRHDEASWRRRLPGALRFLLAA